MLRPTRRTARNPWCTQIAGRATRAPAGLARQLQKLAQLRCIYTYSFSGCTRVCAYGCCMKVPVRACHFRALATYESCGTCCSYKNISIQLFGMFYMYLVWTHTLAGERHSGSFHDGTCTREFELSRRSWQMALGLSKITNPTMVMSGS